MGETPKPGSPLPDDPKLLQEMIAQLLEELRSKDHTIETLTTWIANLRRHQFGRKSETLDPSQQQMLFTMVEGMLARKSEPAPEPEEPPAPPPSRPQGRTKLPKNLLRDTVVHDVPKKDRRCMHCKTMLVEIDRIVTEQVDHVPASTFVREIVRLKYG